MEQKFRGSLKKEYGTDSSCIYRWISRYRAGGMDALKTRPIAHSKNSKLTPEQLSFTTPIDIFLKPVVKGLIRYSGILFCHLFNTSSKA
ncbi:helix-turn-helix domain-containing protein [Endozoicomonas atrinae]|uniref:helix-turn-helix domain-containing protein n=1 Tax=Endozoicomonas atrinae TaxID=1333660 RepID=UPI003B00D5E4